MSKKKAAAGLAAVALALTAVSPAAFAATGTKGPVFQAAAITVDGAPIAQLGGCLRNFGPSRSEVRSYTLFA